MSYTSENEDEEFFDASDMTPYSSDVKRNKKSINSSNVEEAVGKDDMEQKDEAMDCLSKKLDFNDLNSTTTGWKELHHSDETLECKAKKSVVIHEPDIIQSTKSGSLPRQQLPVPMVPPRKKKAKSADVPLPSLCDEKVIASNEELHVSLVDPESDDLPHAPRMPECTSPMLDISSATKGICLVSLCEQETVCEQENSAESFHSTKDGGEDDDDDSSYDDPPPQEEEEDSTCKYMEENGKPLPEDVLLQGVPSGTRPRTISGSRFMTDKVFVLNLDTGETVPLSSAEEKIPKCINPLSLHIMRRTKEYLSSDSNLHKGECSDNESLKDIPNETKKSKSSTGRKRMKIKQFIGKTVHKIKAVTEKASHADDTSTDDDEASENRKAIKIKTSHSHKGPYDFDLLVPIQEIGDNKSGAVWTMKFSHCGRLLATGGQDGVLRVWVVRDAFKFFNELRIKYNDAAGKATLSMATPCDGQTAQAEDFEKQESDDYDPESAHMPFQKRPFCSYTGHTADVLDVSWSKNYFLLSSSMDKTVRLWHISRRECLCCFQHIDFVTAISFHPKDDRYFLSGSLDGKLRLWNIPDKKVALWNEVSGPTKLITAANFCLNGRFAVVGTYDGRCIFYNSEQLKYFTQIHVRSTRGKNSRGRKITGVEPLHGEDKILVTSNDSRIRLYDLRDLTLTCKYKGVTNNSSQIKASFSHDGRYVVCGSEDQFVYIWRTQHEFYKFSSARRDRNDYWEGIKAHSAVVTNAIFAPNPRAIIKPQFEFVDLEDKDNMKGGQGEVLVSADYLGSIRVFINKFKPTP